MHFQQCFCETLGKVTNFGEQVPIFAFCSIFAGFQST